MATAEKVSERSRPTLRRWIKAGELTRYEGDAPAHGGSPIALVSRAELLKLLVSKGQTPRPVDDPPTDQPIETPRRPDSGEPEQPRSPVAPDERPTDAALVEEVRRLRMAAEVASVRAEAERIKLEAEKAVEVARLSGELAGVRAELAAERQRLADLQQQLAAAVLDRDDWKGRHDAARAEAEALRGAAGLPWWRRLLTGGS